MLITTSVRNQETNNTKDNMDGIEELWRNIENADPTKNTTDKPSEVSKESAIKS